VCNHRTEARQRLVEQMNRQVHRTLLELRAREEARSPLDFRSFADGRPSPLLHASREAMVAADARFDGERLDSPHRSRGAEEARVLRLRGGPVAARTHRALAWCDRHIGELRKWFEESRDLTLEPVEEGGGAAFASGYQIFTGPEGRPVLWRRVEWVEGAAEIQLLALDVERCRELGGEAAARVSPRIVARWRPTPAAPLGFAYEIPEEVLAQVTGSANVDHLLAIGVLLCAIGLIGGFWLLRRLRRQLDREQAFSAAVSHELKTPVAAVRVLADNLAEGRVGSEARRKEYFHLISREATRLACMVDNVLDQARLDHGRLQLVPRPRQLNEACRDVTIAWPDLEIELDLDDQADLVAVDGEAMRRILTNLIDNARKYAPGSPVRVATRNEGREVLVEVADRGPGIPAAKRQQVLDAWQRAAGHDHQPGLGLGLSLVAQLVAAHGGRIKLRDNRPTGLVVELHLPLRLDEYLGR